MEERLRTAWKTQRARYDNPVTRNAEADVAKAGGAFALGEKGRQWWRTQSEREATSHRMLDKLLRVARTIADLEASERIELCHLQEASLFRCIPQTIAGWH